MKINNEENQRKKMKLREEKEGKEEKGKERT